MKSRIMVVMASVVVLGAIVWMLRSHAPAGRLDGAGATNAAASSVSGSNPQPESSSEALAGDGSSSASGSPTPGASSDPNNHDATRAPVRANPGVQLESRLLVPHGIRVMDTNALLDAGRFEDVLRTINSGATADTLEMANIYREDFGGALSKTNFKLEDIACGEHLCAAIFKGKLNDENAFNNAVMAEGNRAKIYAIVQKAVAPVSSGDPTEYRMIFTTDPKYGGLVVDYYPQTQTN